MWRDPGALRERLEPHARGFSHRRLAVHKVSLPILLESEASTLEREVAVMLGQMRRDE
jgi:hypothetical protein